MSTAVFPSRSAIVRLRALSDAADGKGLQLRGMQQSRVVNWGEGSDPNRLHSPGPNTQHYEQFPGLAGAHLVLNALWQT